MHVYIYISISKLCFYTNICVLTVSQQQKATFKSQCMYESLYCKNHQKIHILCHIFVRHVNKKNPRIFFLMLYSTFEVRQNLHEVKLFTVAKIHAWCGCRIIDYIFCTLLGGKIARDLSIYIYR